MIFAKFAITIILSYLLGSIPFGVVIGRLFANVDVRNYGSGKMGATNVMRVAGKKAAVIVFICDLLKGVVAVSIAWVIFSGGAKVVPDSADGGWLEVLPRLPRWRRWSATPGRFFSSFKAGGASPLSTAVWLFCVPRHF